MSHDPSIEDRLRALQTYANTGICRSPAQEGLDTSLDRLQSILDQLLAQLDPSRLEVESVSDLYKVSIALTGLKRAHTEAEKARLDAEDHHQKALAEFQDQLRQDLRDHPELVSQLKKLAHAAAEKVANKPRAGRPKKHHQNKEK